MFIKYIYYVYINIFSIQKYIIKRFKKDWDKL